MPRTQTVTFTYMLSDSGGMEWGIRVRAKVNMGSPRERDEVGFTYDGEDPSVEELNMFWVFSKGRDALVVDKRWVPPPMLNTIEAHAISLANEQAFQEILS